MWVDSGPLVGFGMPSEGYEAYVTLLVTMHPHLFRRCYSTPHKILKQVFIAANVTSSYLVIMNIGRSSSPPPSPARDGLVDDLVARAEALSSLSAPDEASAFVPESSRSSVTTPSGEDHGRTLFGSSGVENNGESLVFSFLFPVGLSSRRGFVLSGGVRL